ncbi:GTPase Era [anaerobic digester metagenome]
MSPLLNRILELVPESPAWYDKDLFTDRNLRFFASEIIREKILLTYDKEIPYSTEVTIDTFTEGPELYSIEAVINVMRDSQKGIIIGKGGSAIKKVGTLARKDMESFFEKKVFLQIFVKVNPDWREDKRKLKQFGYIQD